MLAHLTQKAAPARTRACGRDVRGRVDGGTRVRVCVDVDVDVWMWMWMGECSGSGGGGTEEKQNGRQL